MKSLTSLILSMALALPAQAEDARERSKQALDAAEQAARSGAVRAMPNIGTMPRGEIDVGKIAEQYRQLGAKPAGDEGLMIFVSHSMPKATLVKLARQARRAGAVMVFRGVPGDLTSKTWLESMAAMQPLVDTGAAVQIHPDLFKEYDVRRVPTFVIVDGSGSGSGCSEKFGCTGRLVAVGDVSLDYVLERWAVGRSALARKAQIALDRMEAAR